jgi:hypothetical protein
MGWLPQATDTNRRRHDKITACIPAGSVHADRSPRTNGQESVARASSVQRPLPATRAPTTSPAPSSSGKRDACLALLTHQPSVEQASSAARPTRERPATTPSRVAERLVRSTRPARVPHGLPLLPLSLMHRRDTHDARDRAELPVFQRLRAAIHPRVVSTLSSRQLSQPSIADSSESLRGESSRDPLASERSMAATNNAPGRKSATSSDRQCEEIDTRTAAPSLRK